MELLITYAVAIAALAVVVGLIWWERRKCRMAHYGIR